MSGGSVPPLHAHDIAERLNLHKAHFGRSEWRGACPACGYADGLILSEKDGRPLWWCASCQDGRAIGSAIRSTFGDDGWTPPPLVPATSVRSAAQRTGRAMRVWDQTQPLEGSLAEHYLEARGILHWWRQFPRHAYPGWQEVLRFHPCCVHPAGSGLKLPALIALVRNVSTGKPVAIHRTFLSMGGRRKADIEPAKASLGPVQGGAVLLQPPVGDAPLVIAEGIETALAAGHLMHAPAWAAVSAGNLGQLHIPKDIGPVVIAADPDRPGQTAARAAWGRWTAQGRSVRIATPNYTDQDFNDLLMESLHG